MTIEADQSAEFDRYAPRPWHRFFAKQIDITLYSIVLLLVILSLPSYDFGLHPSDVKWVELFILEPIVVILSCLIDAVLLAAIGTSAGRHLFKIQVSFLHLEKVPLWAALKRSLKLFIVGLGLGLPLVSLLTMISSYKQLVAKRTTPWDSSEGFIVTHAEAGTMRRIVQIAVVALMFAMQIAGHFA